MRITDLRLEKSELSTKAVAMVRWEDCGLPEKEVFIATEAEFEQNFSANPHAFLAGCLLPAMRLGEKRLQLDGPVCPSLLENLHTVMGIMRFWSGGELKPLAIETEKADAPLFAGKPQRAAMFMSGGMDSLCTLRMNRLNYAPEHPAYVRDCLIIHGFDIGGVIARGAKYHVYDRARQRLQKVTDEAGARLVPVYTNIRHLHDEREFWLNRFYSAVLAACAHSFAPAYNLVYVASGLDLPKLAPCGSHPLLDHEYSSYDLSIKHAHLELCRLEKIKVVAGWETALNNFRVCLANKPERYNCGQCEKCIRTMTGLAAAGVLHKTDAFEGDEVTPEMIMRYNIRDHHRAQFYQELIPALRERGREDLVAAIREATE